MRFKLPALVAALGFLSASAYAVPLQPVQGYAVTVGGRAHVERQAAGTYLYFNGPTSIGGVVPFDDKSTFPGLYDLDGRYVQLTGVVDSKGLITLTDPDQLKVLD